MTATHEPRSTGAGALICIPTYNERENLVGITRAVLEQAPGAEVLIVDDASPDGTGELADEIAAEDQRVHVLHRQGKEGLGRAYVAAFEWALERDYEFVFQFDADFSHDPKYLPRFIEELRSGADAIVGSRRVSGGGVRDWGLSRRLISWGGSTYARTVLGIPIRDLTGGFNGYRRAVLERVDIRGLDATGYMFQIELKYRAHQAGFRIVELPIVFPDRVHGESKMSTSIFGEALVGVLKLRLGIR